MDAVGGFHLADGVELKAVSGIDDNSRFAVSAKLVPRATAKPVCEALLAALRRHGVPDQILTDNGKVFIGRFGPAALSAEVMFDRICAENGIRHLLTAPRSPTTTGKVERWHKTIRAEFLTEHDRRHFTLPDLQQALDGWVVHYNTERRTTSGPLAPATNNCSNFRASEASDALTASQTGSRLRSPVGLLRSRQLGLMLETIVYGSTGLLALWSRPSATCHGGTTRTAKT